MILKLCDSGFKKSDGTQITLCSLKNKVLKKKRQQLKFKQKSRYLLYIIITIIMKKLIL